MKWHTEMHLRGSRPFDDSRFDALADALADIDAADPAIEDVDLSASLAQGWAIASMNVEADDAPDAVRKTIATVRAAIQAMGDRTPGWDRLTDSPSVTVRPSDTEPLSPAWA